MSMFCTLEKNSNIICNKIPAIIANPVSLVSRWLYTSGSSSKTVSDNRKAPLKANNSLMFFMGLFCVSLTTTKPRITAYMGNKYLFILHKNHY